MRWKSECKINNESKDANEEIAWNITESLHDLTLNFANIDGHATLGTTNLIHLFFSKNLIILPSSGSFLKFYKFQYFVLNQIWRKRKKETCLSK